VRRVWPDGLRIAVDEHRLVARWGSDAWLNEQGEVVKLAAVEQADVLRLAGPEGASAEENIELRRWHPPGFDPAPPFAAQRSLPALRAI